MTVDDVAVCLLISIYFQSVRFFLRVKYYLISWLELDEMRERKNIPYHINTECRHIFNIHLLNNNEFFYIIFVFATKIRILTDFGHLVRLLPTAKLNIVAHGSVNDIISAFIRTSKHHRAKWHNVLFFYFILLWIWRQFVGSALENERYIVIFNDTGLCVDTARGHCYRCVAYHHGHFPM